MFPCIRGTLHIAVDTNLVFKDNFIAHYKGTDFKYIIGKESSESGVRQSDCIVARINRTPESTYNTITELVSLWSYSHDCGFIVRGSSSDKFLGDLVDRRPGVSQKKMLSKDFRTDILSIELQVCMKLPLIVTPLQSNIVRLYRLARTAEYFDPIASFLYYFHIIDYPLEADAKKGISIQYIDKFRSTVSQGSQEQTFIDLILKDRVFDKTKSNANDTNFSLGEYITSKVRGSVAHIVRYDYNDAANLEIDSFGQMSHFYHLLRIMKPIARYKMNAEYSFNVYCGKDILYLHTGFEGLEQEL